MNFKWEQRNHGFNKPEISNKSIFYLVRSDKGKTSELEAAGIYKIEYIDGNWKKSACGSLIKRKILEGMKEHKNDFSSGKDK